MNIDEIRETYEQSRADQGLTPRVDDPSINAQLDVLLSVKPATRSEDDQGRTSNTHAA